MKKSGLMVGLRAVGVWQQIAGCFFYL